MITRSVDDNERVLRKFEREVLDSYHLSLPVMRRAASTALYAVMAAYDSMLVALVSISAQIPEGAIGSRQSVRAIVESINPALRWITSGRPLVAPEPSPNVQLIDEGGELLTHARDYYQISVFHVMYGRGLISAECDEEAKLVRFIRPPGRKFPHGFASAVVGQLANRRGGAERNHILQAARPYIPRLSYRLERGRIHFTNPRELVSQEVVGLAELFSPPETLKVLDDIDLVGFTIGEFRSFWRALHCWSIAASELYLHLAFNGVPQEQCMPTQIVPRREFFDSMELLTALPRRVIKSIADRLTYDVMDERRDLFLQPLVCSHGSISWCPLAIKQSRPERNMMKLMSRSAPLRNAAATIIGGREQEMLNQLGMLLAKRNGYDYKLNCKLRHQGRNVELDLLAYNRKAPDEVLLVEGKAVLAVDEVAEVQAATEQFNKAQGQLNRVSEIMVSMPEDQKRALYPFVDWGRVRTYRPIVVTPDSNPLADFNLSAIPVITLELIRTKLRSRDFKSPTAIWEACQRKDWLKLFALDGEDLFSSITIGSVRYEFPTRGDRFDV